MATLLGFYYGRWLENKPFADLIEKLNNMDPLLPIEDPVVIFYCKRYGLMENEMVEQAEQISTSMVVVRPGELR